MMENNLIEELKANIGAVMNDDFIDDEFKEQYYIESVLRVTGKFKPVILEYAYKIGDHFMSREEWDSLDEEEQLVYAEVSFGEILASWKEANEEEYDTVLQTLL